MSKPNGSPIHAAAAAAVRDVNLQFSSEIFSNLQSNTRNGKTNPTPATSPRSLNARQLRAVQLLLEGKREVVVAQLVGVTPQTISRWKNQTPAFAAELLRCHRDSFRVREEQRERERERRRAEYAARGLRCTAPSAYSAGAGPAADGGGATSR
jgi:hypothetical protein